MSILYRPQRGSLDESLEEVKTFNNLKEMLEYCVEEHEKAFDILDIYISYYCYDDRINWETYIVTTAKYGDEDCIKEYGCPQAIGFCTFREKGGAGNG